MSRERRCIPPPGCRVAPRARTHGGEATRARRPTGRRSPPGGAGSAAGGRPGQPAPPAGENGRSRCGRGHRYAAGPAPEPRLRAAGPGERCVPAATPGDGDSRRGGGSTRERRLPRNRGRPRAIAGCRPVRSRRGAPPRQPAEAPRGCPADRSGEPSPAPGRRRRRWRGEERISPARSAPGRNGRPPWNAGAGPRGSPESPAGRSSRARRGRPALARGPPRRDVRAPSRYSSKCSSPFPPLLLAGLFPRRPVPLLQGLQVLQRQLARLQQPAHQRLCRAVEEAQEVVDEALVDRLARDQRLEQQGVADLARAAHGLFFLEPREDRLDRRIGRALALLDRLLDLPDRGLAQGPEDLHDLELETAEVDRTLSGHSISYNCRRITYSGGSTVSRGTFQPRAVFGPPSRRAGRNSSAFRKEKTASRVIPSSRNGSDRSHTKG